jgi:phenylacetate-coenzyme A ligase PaaK-like adenylate-forming protein
MTGTYINKIFGKDRKDFTAISMEAFVMQFENNKLYRAYSELTGKHPGNVHRPEDIPFLPISFFKTSKIATLFGGEEKQPEAIFESSGTTGATTARHYVTDTGLYKQSFMAGFRRFYGEPSNWCILALLPSYLERNHSSLVYMANELMQQSGHPLNGFFLNEFETLHQRLGQLEADKHPTILLGVGFGLLRFSEQYPIPLKHAVVMETGGMKGRDREPTREELHDTLCKRFGLQQIHSEYGMTELLSQAYSTGKGLFHGSQTMQALVRDTDDPLTVKTSGRGALNIIDLANINSCCFIATDDAVRVYENGSFEVLGRLDHSDTRGCSMLVL